MYYTAWHFLPIALALSGIECRELKIQQIVASQPEDSKYVYLIGQIEKGLCLYGKTITIHKCDLPNV